MLALGSSAQAELQENPDGSTFVRPDYFRETHHRGHAKDFATAWDGTKKNPVSLRVAYKFYTNTKRPRVNFQSDLRKARKRVPTIKRLSKDGAIGAFVGYIEDSRMCMYEYLIYTETGIYNIRYGSAEKRSSKLKKKLKREGDALFQSFKIKS